jgi:hypothetical protein
MARRALAAAGLSANVRPGAFMSDLRSGAMVLVGLCVAAFAVST